MPAIIPTLKLKYSQSFRFFAHVEVSFFMKNCLVLRMWFTSNVDGTSTLKRLFKVDIPSALKEIVLISKIVEIEIKINVQFEHVHVKTKQDNEEIKNSYGKKLVLECDQKAK